MENMLQESLRLSIQRHYFCLGLRRHQLTTENYFVSLRWNPEQFFYVFYTEEELRTLHRIFNHTLVNQLEINVRRGNRRNLEAQTQKIIEKIRGRIYNMCGNCIQTVKEGAYRRKKGSSDLTIVYR